MYVLQISTLTNCNYSEEKYEKFAYDTYPYFSCLHDQVKNTRIQIQLPSRNTKKIFRTY